MHLNVSFLPFLLDSLAWQPLLAGMAGISKKSLLFLPIRASQASRAANFAWNSQEVPKSALLSTQITSDPCCSGSIRKSNGFDQKWLGFTTFGTFLHFSCTFLSRIVGATASTIKSAHFTAKMCTFEHNFTSVLCRHVAPWESRDLSEKCIKSAQISTKLAPN